MAHPDLEILELGLAQGGVVTRIQALDLGFTTHQIATRVRRQQWIPLGRTAYRVAPVTGHIELCRAAVAALPSPVVSHETAAELHKFPDIRRGLSVVTVHTRTTHDFEGLVVHRAHDIRPEDVVQIAELPVTSPARTVIDLAARISDDRLTRLADDLIARRVIRMTDLEEVAAHTCRRGRPGSAAIGEYLMQRLKSPAIGSELERRGRALLALVGPEPFVSEFSIPWAPWRRFDDAYVDHRLAIEWDSRSFHLRMDAFQTDRERDRDAVVNEWRILRFTWSDVTERRHEVISTVRAALGARTVG